MYLCFVLQLVDTLPLEVLEMILLRYAATIFAAKMDTSRDSDVTLMTSSLLHVASVAYSWYMAVTGWPCSDTSRWFRHTIKRLMNRCERNFTSLIFLYTISYTVILTMTKSLLAYILNYPCNNGIHPEKQDFYVRKHIVLSEY